jgi:hypothetical protein
MASKISVRYCLSCRGTVKANNRRGSISRKETPQRQISETINAHFALVFLPYDAE